MNRKLFQLRPAQRALVSALALGAVLATSIALLGSEAGAQDLQSELDEKEAKLDQKQEQKGVLSTELQRFDEQIDVLRGQVAELRNREALVLQRLEETEAALADENQHLSDLRDRLGWSLKVLRERLVSIYKSGEPDLLTVILDSDGFNDLVSRYEYLDRIQDRDSGIVDEVTSLRDESLATVQRIREARNEIEARKEELEDTRAKLEEQEAELNVVRGQKASALAQIGADIDHLEGDIHDLSAKIADQLAAAGASTTTSDPLPAGPVQGAANGFIWPVNGPVVSPFGWRWGRMHEGIDIAVPAGTPIRAVKDGSIVLVQSDAESGGYGNFTCIDHGGGLASCYAHQSSFAITSGSVAQGAVIGYVGCTGHCFGDHLHFEVRVNGAAQDPLAYL